MVFAAAPAVHPSLQFDTELIRRLDGPGPRYASYPTAGRFSDSFRYGDYLQAVSSVGDWHIRSAFPATSRRSWNSCMRWPPRACWR